MKKYKFYLMSIIVLLFGLLCGCKNSEAELSLQQEAMITEYATSLLVKYSPVADRKLLNKTELENEILKETEEQERLLKSKELAERYMQAAEKGETVTDEQADAESAMGDTAGEIQPQQSVSEFFQEDMIAIDYLSYSLCDSYPEYSEEEFFMAMDATPGTQLCIVSFSVKNLSGEEQTLNMLNKQGRFSLRIDGGNSIQAQSTLLTDDLSSYSGTLPANGEEKMVLVFEVPADLSQIDSMDLIMRNAEGENVLTLQ